MKLSGEMGKKFEANNKDTSPLAVLLCFETGMRVGELSALKISDIHGHYIHVQRQSVREYEKVDDTCLKMIGWKVVDYTKMEDGDREIYLTNETLNIIDLVLETNRKNNEKCGDYIFVKDGKRIKPSDIDYVITFGCEKAGLSVKRIHKVRKTYISTLIDSGLNIDEIRRQVGHNDERTTYNNYCYNRLTNTETERVIENALSCSGNQESNQSNQ